MKQLQVTTTISPRSVLIFILQVKMDKLSSRRTSEKKLLTLMCNGRGPVETPPLLSNFGTPPFFRDPVVDRCIIKLVIVA